MKLSELKTGEKGIITRVTGHGSFRKRVIDLGFVNGKTVRVVRNAPLKDPVEYEVMGSQVALQRDDFGRLPRKRAARRHGRGQGLERGTCRHVAADEGRI